MTSTHEPSALLARRDAARVLGVSITTMKRWEKAGVLKPIKVAGWPRFRRADIDALIKDGAP
jgi:predicted site-specific integrase-resolvase